MTFIATLYEFIFEGISDKIQLTFFFNKKRYFNISIQCPIFPI